MVARRQIRNVKPYCLHKRNSSSLCWLKGVETRVFVPSPRVGLNGGFLPLLAANLAQVFTRKGLVGTAPPHGIAEASAYSLCPALSKS